MTKAGIDPISEADRPALDRREAIERLAERLYFVMEKLDPTPGAEAWANLPEMDRDFYRAVVRSIADEGALLRKILR